MPKKKSGGRQKNGHGRHKFVNRCEKKVSGKKVRGIFFAETAKIKSASKSVSGK
jgi:hypothetical protein